MAFVSLPRISSRAQTGRQRQSTVHSAWSDNRSVIADWHLSEERSLAPAGLSTTIRPFHTEEVL